MRADARRNHDAVLEAGARLLAERPGASMQEIADASGVGRTTVYRHFPAREDLVRALIERVTEEVSAATHDAIDEERPAADVLRQLAAELVALGSRWRFLREQRPQVQASVTASDQAFQDWAERAQARGELRTDWPAGWILAVSRGMTTAAIDETDRLGAEEAGRLLGETLISALEPRG